MGERGHCRYRNNCGTRCISKKIIIFFPSCTWAEGLTRAQSLGSEGEEVGQVICPIQIFLYAFFYRWNNTCLFRLQHSVNFFNFRNVPTFTPLSPVRPANGILSSQEMTEQTVEAPESNTGHLSSKNYPPILDIYSSICYSTSKLQT